MNTVSSYKVRLYSHLKLLPFFAFDTAAQGISNVGSNLVGRGLQPQQYEYGLQFQYVRRERTELKQAILFLRGKEEYKLQQMSLFFLDFVYQVVLFLYGEDDLTTTRSYEMIQAHVCYFLYSFYIC